MFIINLMRNDSMKNLYKYLLNESLLDDELEDKVDDIAYSNILNKNNRFLFDGALTLHNIKYGGKQFLEPHTYSNGKVTLNSTQEISQKKSFDIKKYIPEADTVEVIWRYDGGPVYGSWRISSAYSGWELSPNTTFKNIICSKFEVEDWGMRIKDINIEIKHNKGVNSLMCYFANPTSLKNLNINFQESAKKSCIRVNSTIDELEFKNIKSNANVLHFYDPFMFDEFDDIAAKIFEFPQTCNIDDKNKGEVKVAVKNFKKVKAICNNQKRYSLIEDPLLVLKKGAKLSDIVDIKGFSNLESVTFADNNVELIFQKEKQRRYLACMPYSQMENPPKTADGFYVYLESRK